jgi:octaprenyl-diphosphate synthase
MALMVAQAPNFIKNSSKKILIDIQDLLAHDLAATNSLIIEQLDSDVGIIKTIAKRIIDSGGKRLRPLLVLLSANYFECTSPSHHELAAIIEFIHTATLLHDDVVDESSQRRGQDTANQIWGNQISVLVGDFLYSRAFQLLNRRNDPAIMKVLAQTTNLIAEGEVSQLVNRHNPDLNEKDYLEVIRRKTACLFSAAAETGALLGKTCTPDSQQTMAIFGLNLGIAFQMIDDLLDYTSNEMGKNKGDDLSEGRATLPLIYTLQHCSSPQAELIRRSIRQGDISQLAEIISIMESVKAQQYTWSLAQKYANLALLALSHIKSNPYLQAMKQLVTFILERDF